MGGAEEVLKNAGYWHYSAAIAGKKRSTNSTKQCSKIYISYHSFSDGTRSHLTYGMVVSQGWWKMGELA